MSKLGIIPMKDKIKTRMGDGELVSMAAGEIKDDILAATHEAAQCAEIPELSPDEMDQLFEILAEPSRAVSVRPGQEVIVTDDGCSMSFYSGQDSGGVGVSLSRMQAILTYERACAADTTSMGHSDYSFKPVKPIINSEMSEYYTTSMMTTAPFLYGAQPNMGLYFQPDGPHQNPADLLPQGKIKEAQEVQEAAAEQLREDLVFVGKKLNDIGRIRIRNARGDNFSRPATGRNVSPPAGPDCRSGGSQYFRGGHRHQHQSILSMESRPGHNIR